MISTSVAVSILFGRKCSVGGDVLGRTPSSLPRDDVPLTTFSITRCDFFAPLRPVDELWVRVFWPFFDLRVLYRKMKSW